MEDAAATGRILNFSEAEMDEWRALSNFWEQHQTPESLPASPHTINMDDGRSYTMHGPPSWAELWRVLRRFSRPHHQTQPPPPPPPQHTAGGGAPLVVPPLVAAGGGTQLVAAGGGTQLAVGDGGGMQPPPPISGADRLLLMNRVGGTNALPAMRRAAHSRKSAREHMIEMGRNVSSVILDQPYFVEISHCEGEIMVGIAVPRRRTVNTDGGVDYDCEWFSRKPYATLSSPTRRLASRTLSSSTHTMPPPNVGGRISLARLPTSGRQTPSSSRAFNPCPSQPRRGGGRENPTSKHTHMYALHTCVPHYIHGCIV